MSVGPLVVPVKLMIKKSELEKTKRVLQGLKIAMIGLDVPKKPSKKQKGSSCLGGHYQTRRD